MLSDPRHGPTLYSTSGARKYLTEIERQRVLAATEAFPDDEKLFVQTLCWSGARISELLAITVSNLYASCDVLALTTLKRRRHVVREIPLPPALAAQLVNYVACRFDSNKFDSRLWPWSRTTAWRLVKRAMVLGDVSSKVAMPKGLRHAFGVGTLARGVPINLVQRWLGHASLKTTAIYADAVGEEERRWAQRYWQTPAKPSDNQTDGLKELARVSATDLRMNASRFQDMALTRPVVITRNGRDRVVLLSAEEYLRLKSLDS